VPKRLNRFHGGGEFHFHYLQLLPPPAISEIRAPWINFDRCFGSLRSLESFKPSTTRNSNADSKEHPRQPLVLLDIRSKSAVPVQIQALFEKRLSNRPAGNGISSLTN
jgi:hypothetical protein